MRGSELGDLVAFVAVAEERSFTRAAAKLGVSQSALSFTIRRLEARLGLRLLNRTTRSVAPTEGGERLLRTLRPAFDQIDTELGALGALRDKPAGMIRITANDHVADTILLPAISRLLPGFLDVKVEIDIDYGLADIVADRYDAGVRLGEPGGEGHDRRSHRAGLAHGGGRRTFVLCDAASAEVAAGSRQPQLHQKRGRELRVRVAGQLVFNGMYQILEAARAGLGLACLLDDVVQTDVAEGRLKRVLIDWCPPFSGYHLYYPSRSQTAPAFALLVDALRYKREPGPQPRSPRRPAARTLTSPKRE